MTVVGRKEARHAAVAVGVMLLAMCPTGCRGATPDDGEPATARRPIADAAHGAPALASSPLDLVRVAVPSGLAVTGLAVDSAGSPHVTLSGSGDAYYARVRGDRIKADELVRVNSQAGTVGAHGEAGPKISIGSAGRLHVVWHNWTPETGGIVYCASREPGRAAFSPAVTVGRGILPNVAAGDSGVVSVVWLGEGSDGGDGGDAVMAAPLTLATSLDGARSFGASSPVAGAPIACECCLPAIRFNNLGGVVIAFRGAESNVRDVFVARGRQPGGEFTIVRVHEDNWVLKACPNSGPAFVLDEGRGILAVAWASQEKALLAISEDAGRTFRAPEIVLGAAPTIGEFPMAGVDARGGVGVAWATRHGARGIALRRSLDAYFVGESGLFVLPRTSD